MNRKANAVALRPPVAFVPEHPGQPEHDHRAEHDERQPAGVPAPIGPRCHMLLPYAVGTWLRFVLFVAHGLPDQ